MSNALFQNTGGFHVWKTSPGVLTTIMTILSASLFKKIEIITFLNGTFDQAENVRQEFERLRTFHKKLGNIKIKTAGIKLFL